MGDVNNSVVAFPAIDLDLKNTEIIKKTYKKLVKKYHPDYNMGNKEYENKIKEINQAYNDIKDIK